MNYNLLILPNEILIEIFRRVAPLTAISAMFVNRRFLNILPKNLTRQQRVIRFIMKRIVQKFPSKEEWSCISMNKWISEDFIEKYIGDINWFRLAECSTFGDKFWNKYAHKLYSGTSKIRWENYTSNKSLSEDFWRKYITREDDIDWRRLCLNLKVSDKFWKDYLDKISWQHFRQNPYLSERIVVKYIKYREYLGSLCSKAKYLEKYFAENIDKIIDEELWFDLSENKNLSENFWRAHIKHVYNEITWHSLCSNPNISERFWEEILDPESSTYFLKDKIQWTYLTLHANLSGDFWEKHPVGWRYLCSNPYLSDDFWNKHIDEIDWVEISQNHSLSEEFWINHWNKISNWPDLFDNKFYKF